MITFRKVAGRKIACWVNEEGLVEGRKNLLFVHGSGGDHTLWKNQYGELSTEYNIVAVDLPGHGRSEGPGEQKVDRYVAWVKGIIEALDLRQPVIIGHSLGAAISLTFAIEYGDLLSGIIPVGSGVTMPVNAMILDGIRSDTAKTLAIVAKFSVAKENREHFGQSLIEDMLKVSPEIIYGDFLSCDRLDIAEDISRITIPALLVCGDEDKMTPPVLSQYMKDHIPGAELALIEKSGHFVMWENVTAFNWALQNFVRRLP